MPIPLTGVAIGNGLSAPHIQYAAYADYAIQEDLIDEKVSGRRASRGLIVWAQPCWGEEHSRG